VWIVFKHFSQPLFDLCLPEVTLSALNAMESDVDIEALSEHQLTT